MSHPKKLSLWQKIKQFLTQPMAKTGQTSGSSSKQPKAATHPELDKQSKQYDAGMNLSAQSSHVKVSGTSDQNSASQSERPLTKDKGAGIAQPLPSFKQLTSDSQASHTTHSSPITSRFSQYLKAQHWHFTHYRPKPNDSQQTHHLSLRMKHESVNWVCLFRIQERSQLVAVYGILPFMIPDSHRSAAMLLLTQLNYDMILGNIEMDLNDGEIRYKTSLDIEATGLSDEIISYLIQSVIAMTTVSYELFNDLLDNPEPAQDIEHLLDQIRQQVDSRTYFLASDQVQ